jgi:hypothetical protein
MKQVLLIFLPLCAFLSVARISYARKWAQYEQNPYLITMETKGDWT